MSRHQTELSVKAARPAALDGCARAAAMLGWRVTRRDGDGLTCAQVAPTPLAMGNPVTVDVTVRTETAGVTTLLLQGRNFGFGPLQSRYVRQWVEELAAAIQQAAMRQPDAEPGTGGVRNVVINSTRLSDAQVSAMEQAYRTRIHDGAYWYDRNCGAWGIQGGPASGFIQPGLDLGGPLRADASNGDTGVFINGRQLHRVDVLGLQQVGPVWPGRYWVDAMGNFGVEGGMALGNLWMLAQQRQSAGAGSGGGPWSVYAGGGVAAGDGQGALFAQFGDQTWSNW